MQEEKQKYEKTELKNGIYLYTINENKYKTNLIQISFVLSNTRETITKNILTAMILKEGSKNYPTKREISYKLAENYGADLDLDISKSGDNLIITYSITCINDKFTNDNIWNNCVNLLLDIVFNPQIIDGKFSQNNFNKCKARLINIIESKIDNKRIYAQTRCIEEMYKDKPFGIYKDGYKEDLEENDFINPQKLYENYKQIIENARINIAMSGENINNKLLLGNPKFKGILEDLNERKPKYKLQAERDYKNNDKEIIEHQDVTQGQIVIGLDLNLDNVNNELDNDLNNSLDNAGNMDIKVHSGNNKIIAKVYNAVLGGTPSAKLFQNVREKASLAYVASSIYNQRTNNIFIMAGIEIKNYEKATKVINEQLEDMKKGNIEKIEMEQAKTNLISALKEVQEDQESEMSYYIIQDIYEEKMSFAEYEEKIKAVTKEDIVNFAQKVSVNIRYFLTNS